PPRGEYVLVIDAPHDQRVAGRTPASSIAPVDEVTARWLAALRDEMPASRAAAIAAKASGLPRATLYRALGARAQAD
ncbi:MAG TPA: hypothetical protein VEE84_07715, partial [Burkholderiaceae bacterium]|nr:hypothetical protein [Burkholderiaceae bacterium]